MYDAEKYAEAKRERELAAAGCVGILRGLFHAGVIPDHHRVSIERELAAYDAACERAADAA